LDETMRGPRVLLLEDDHALLRALRVALSSRGYYATEALPGNDVIALVKRTKPDVVLVDLAMSPCDGVDMCRRIRAQWPGPLIALAEEIDERTAIEMLKFLVMHANKVITHTMIMRAVWGPDLPKTNQMLRYTVLQLRRKLQDDAANPRYLVTEAGIGYRFRLDEPVAELGTVDSAALTRREHSARS
jgi:DNA-binding response OmpR family regulator